MTYRSVFRPDLFSAQTLVVTGGAGGIGRCTAHELASLGARVILVGRKVDKLTRVRDEIREFSERVDYRVCDIREEEPVRAMVADILAEHGPIHGLVNNAGGQFPAPLALINQKGFETVLRTNLVGGFLMAREIFNQSMQEHGGAIVNMVADMWNGMPFMGHSGAARAGMDNFTKTAAVEWAACGVRVNAVAPGFIASSGMDTYQEPVRSMIPQLKSGVPLKRLGTEAEVSAAICFLLSEAAAYVTGTTLRIDGGCNLGTRLFPLPDHTRSVAYQGFPLAQAPEVLSGE